MTYGDTAARLRDLLGRLLHEDQVRDLLGPTGEHAAAAAAIRRYRDAVTVWCIEAVSAATPALELNATVRSRDPAAELRFQLEAAHAATPDNGRLSDHLARDHASPLVTVWQAAARAAVIGERELAAAVDWAWRPQQQSTAVVKDAADIVRGLVVLDLRYRDLPGWRSFPDTLALATAAELCSAATVWRPRDYRVDQLGWQPPAGTIEGPALPGLSGVLQAQHNAHVDLAHFPSALNLRRLLASQAQLSKTAARLAETADPALATAFDNRAQLYGELVRASRSIGGLAGDGGRAAAESINAAARAAQVPATGDAPADSLHTLAHLSTRVDSRIACAIEHGFKQRLYLASVQQSHLAAEPRNGVHQLQQRWETVGSHAQSHLLALARNRLRPPPAVPPPPAPVRQEHRAAYEALLARQHARLADRQPSP